MLIYIKTKPNASKDEVKQVDSTNFEVKVTKTPEKGQANQQIIKLLAKHLGKAKSNVQIVKGHTSKIKVININD
jgi:uncharacterized protein